MTSSLFSRLRFPAVIFSLVASSVGAQVDTTSIRKRMELNHQLVAQRLITTADDAERSRLVDQIGSIRPDAMVPALRAAVTEALRRENAVQRARARRARNGDVLSDQLDPELQLKLVELVVAFGDPAGLDALVGAVGTGGRAVNGIADFGVRAVPALLATIEADSANPYVVSGALNALRHVVEEHREAIPPTQRLRIRALAMERLHTPQRFVSTAVAAAEMALTDGSPMLRSRVLALRDQPNRAFTVGADGAARETMLRQRIDARLRGAPAQPPRTRPRG